MTNTPMDRRHHHHHLGLPNLKSTLAFLPAKAFSEEKFAQKIKLSNQT
jgi:hypothetical protein